MKLHLGCGRDLWDGFINVDIMPGSLVGHDLNTFPYPFPAQSVDSIAMLHVLEHLQNPLLVAQELHRIAKPDAKWTIAVPYGSSDDAWEDPTHLHPFFFNTPFYYSQAAYKRADYGYRGDWTIVERNFIMADFLRGQKDLFNVMMVNRNVVKEAWFVLKAVHPIRDPLTAQDTHPPGHFLFGNDARSIQLHNAKTR